MSDYKNQSATADKGCESLVVADGGEEEEAEEEKQKVLSGGSIQEMSRLKDYEIIHKLGQGTFGVVQKARSKETGELVAIKQLLNHSAKEGFPITAMREITILKQLHHRNVMNIKEMIFEEAHVANPSDLVSQRGSFYTVSPYISSDLVGILENPNIDLKLDEIKCIMKQLLQGTQYIHEQNYLHRDIKAANILVDSNGVLKIADFGLARVYHGDVPRLGMGPGGGEKAYTALVVTRWYRPPEILLGERKYTTSVDLWGIGCVFAELFTGKPILVGKTDAHQAQLIFELVGSPKSWPEAAKLPNKNDFNIGLNCNRTLETRFEKIMPPSAIRLLSGLLTLDPFKRFNALDALDHDFFKTEPLPLSPEQMPQFGECHEIDKEKFSALRNTARQTTKSDHYATQGITDDPRQKKRYEKKVIKNEAGVASNEHYGNFSITHGRDSPRGYNDPNNQHRYVAKEPVSQNGYNFRTKHNYRDEGASYYDNEYHEEKEYEGDYEKGHEYQSGRSRYSKSSSYDYVPRNQQSLASRRGQGTHSRSLGSSFYDKQMRYTNRESTRDENSHARSRNPNNYQPEREYISRSRMDFPSFSGRNRFEQQTSKFPQDPPVRSAVGKGKILYKSANFDTVRNRPEPSVVDSASSGNRHDGYEWTNKRGPSTRIGVTPHDAVKSKETDLEIKANDLQSNKDIEYGSEAKEGSFEKTDTKNSFFEQTEELRSMNAKSVDKSPHSHQKSGTSENQNRSEGKSRVSTLTKDQKHFSEADTKAKLNDSEEVLSVAKGSSRKYSSSIVTRNKASDVTGSFLPKSGSAPSIDEASKNVKSENSPSVAKTTSLNPLTKSTTGTSVSSKLYNNKLATHTPDGMSHKPARTEGVVENDINKKRSRPIGEEPSSCFLQQAKKKLKASATVYVNKETVKYISEQGSDLSESEESAENKKNTHLLDGFLRKEELMRDPNFRKFQNEVLNFNKSVDH
ncbi:BUR1 [Candida oxycetoniae]|uniref:Serine/threonine-protein kinase BUR1 n=1 Tax=Candida oxycetoniae TaxID=497107 RepID=A0AAI9SZ08_9ASCO|nr:BUR1 [Candida oxycetoniae]KAI3405748.2 BUR1 [Candida oxycetoniae]